MNALDQLKNSFGFIKIPFSKGFSVNELYISPTMKNVLSAMEIATSNEEAAVITGASGCGKTNVLRYFINQLDTNSYQCAYIAVNNCKIGEIAKRSLSALGIPAPYQAAGALRKLRDSVMEINASRSQKTILIIDEAQELTTSTLLELKSLLNYKIDSDNLLFLLLCGHTTLDDMLNMVPLESLKRRIRIRCEIKPLSLEETGAYIQHHFTISGQTRKIITDDAVALIYRQSRGNPGEINKYCFNAIIKAAALSKDIIEPSLIEDKNG